jgi:hypothetical protein
MNSVTHRLQHNTVTLHHLIPQGQILPSLDDHLDMEQWRHLRQSDGRLPSLLVKASFSKNGYNIHLTDLSRVWAEKLDKNDIVARARRCNCSIDPSEDVEQYGIFLERVKTALQQHDKTILTLSTARDGNLELHLEAPLPSPLPVFEWQINLMQMSGRSVELNLVSPLLQRAHDLNHRMQLLIAELQAKDKVIAKITDRLETSGYGLANVFPGAANTKLTGKKSQQQQFARHVRGLGKFDEKAWAAEIAAGSNTLSISSNSADAVLVSLPPLVADAAEQEAGMGWWQRLPHGRHIPLGEVKPNATESAQSNKRTQEQSRAGRSNSHEVRDHDDDEFQRQATPPHLRNHSHLSTTHVDTDMDDTGGDPAQDEESTEDEDDLDGPPLKPKPTWHHTNNDETHDHAALEVKSKTPPPPSIVNSTGHTYIARGPFTHEEDTEDDDDDLDGPSQMSQKVSSASQLPSRQKSQTPQPSLSAAPSPRKRPGTFGGRARTKSPTAMSITPSEEHEDPLPAFPSPQKPKAKGKLGMMGGSKTKPQSPSPSAALTEFDAPLPGKKLGTIGGKREAKSSRAATASVTPERQHNESADIREPEMRAEPALPEDPVERANAKRDALKRELEAKAKAPAKKKRKF